MLREQLSEALTVAMKAREQRKVATVRLILAAIKDRDIAARTGGSDESVSEQQIQQILLRMIRQRRESIAAYEQAGRLELAEQEREEIDIVESFLPRQMGEAEIKEACQAVVAEAGAESLKDIGRVMSVLKERFAGRMDFGKASAAVKALLS
ncbi:MAG: GatB/YqeY domain-containing protein [Sphingomonadales bacterium]